MSYNEWRTRMEKDYGKTICQSLHALIEKWNRGQDLHQVITGPLEQAAKDIGFPLYLSEQATKEQVAQTKWIKCIEDRKRGAPEFGHYEQSCAPILFTYVSCSNPIWPPIDFSTSSTELQLWCRRVAFFAAQLWEDNLVSRLKCCYSDEKEVDALRFHILNTMMGYQNYINERGVARDRVQPSSAMASLVEREALQGARLMTLALPNHSSNPIHSDQVVWNREHIFKVGNYSRKK